MSGALSKRQQARNEKVLQDLVQSVPGNNFCADCQARNPAWASWSLGIFLCMRCAAIHRKLGTHISKVKSLSMDSWSNEQVENMRKVGNVTSNKSYNPQNKKPPVPVDADEADSAMERFIRQKYMNHAFSSSKRHNTGSTESDETPPPLPPKTPSRFGFRSASSIFPLGSKHKHQTPPSPRDTPQPSSPHRNKPSQVFGASVEVNNGDGQDMEKKLAKLRDMGFLDEQRNALVLKGVGGSMEKTIEALIRLGEGDGRPAAVPARQSSLPINRSLTPGSLSGHDSARARPISPASNNPFDMLDMPPVAQPLSSQSTGTLQNRNPYLTPNQNPFGMPQQAPGAFDLAFQNMSLAPPSQPLFPNHTGGVAVAQPQAPQGLYQPPMTAPLQPPQNYGTPFQSHTYPQPAQQPTSYNPFYNQPQAPQQPLSVNTASYGGFGSNPFTRSPTRIQSPPLTQIPEQTQQNFYAPGPQPGQAPMTNPFFQTTNMPQQPYGVQMPQQSGQMFQQPGQMPQQPGQMPQQFGQMQPGQMQVPQQPGQMQMPQQGGLAPQMTGYPHAAYQSQRPDKASILALYNYPQLAPNPPSAQDAGGQATDGQAQAPAQQTPTVAPGSKNPFVNAGATPASQGLIDTSIPKGYNASRESVMALGMEWTNGRHSPDAFASLSANTR
ncbi:UBA domain-containing protein 3 [Echria macrotheca]|uniref:UBA domain-containing protein 3 n=1 Tax=Echria macrotheca TaxID=438768 RepID=A0AAJ0F8T4_9PEZI|nr:UBA domain-containing protein 3 [Echria macrotheca]